MSSCRLWVSLVSCMLSKVDESIGDINAPVLLLCARRRTTRKPPAVAAVGGRKALQYAGSQRLENCGARRAAFRPYSARKNDLLNRHE